MGAIHFKKALGVFNFSCGNNTQAGLGMVFVHMCMPYMEGLSSDSRLGLQRGETHPCPLSSEDTVLPDFILSKSSRN